MEDSKKLIKMWKKNGKHFGYPKCCIDHFCREVENTTRLVEDNIVIDGKFNTSGFIPCPTHKQEVLEGKVKLTDLIKGRKEEEIFQEDWTPVNKLFFPIGEEIIPLTTLLKNTKK